MLTSPRRLSLPRALRVDRAVDCLLLGPAAFVAARDEGAPAVAAVVVAATALAWFAGRVVHQYDAENGRGFFGDLALTLVMLAIVVVPIGIATAIHGHFEIALAFAAVLAPSAVGARLLLVGRHLRDRAVDSVIVVGAGALGRITAKEIGEDERRVIGHLAFADEPADAHLHAPSMGTADDLEEVLKEHVVDEVYLAPSGDVHRAEVQKAIEICEKFGVPFAVPVIAYRLTRARPANETGAPDGYAHFLSVHPKPVQLWLKRLFDIALSGLALTILSPILVGTALAVKLTSPGPVLFRQQRVGLHGRTFDMLKFRSMVTNAEALKAKLMSQNEASGPVFKMKRDPRVTAIGRFIRKFSIDELPQLVNVLRGDMSIVGPRPPIPSEVRKYEAWQRRRLSVRPGLTCVWQVSGRSDIGFREWMLLDMRYIDHWSLLQDFELIARTVPVVLTGRGAS